VQLEFFFMESPPKLKPLLFAFVSVTLEQQHFVFSSVSTAGRWDLNRVSVLSSGIITKANFDL
jgi:hypothetical protein